MMEDMEQFELRIDTETQSVYDFDNLIYSDDELPDLQNEIFEEAQLQSHY